MLNEMYADYKEGNSVTVQADIMCGTAADLHLPPYHEIAIPHRRKIGVGTVLYEAKFTSNDKGLKRVKMKGQDHCANQQG